MFTDLSLWFTGLSPLMRGLWICAIVASVIFLIQNALMLMGLGDMDSDTDFDATTDFDGHDGTLGSAGVFSLFTLRNFINFFLGFGWGGISLAGVITRPGWLILVALLCGALFVGVFTLMLRSVLRLESNGAFRIADCVGRNAVVYLRIPAGHTAAGKVEVSDGGSMHEIDAFTDGSELPSGSRVRVVAVIDGATLLVEAL